MAGSGLSISDITITEDILLRSRELEGLLNLESNQLKNTEDKYLVRVLGGTTIRNLNRILDERGLAFGILGGFDAQTIVGVAMTSTHGSSLNYGPISDFIMSMQVVGENGELFQIEPLNGITNPNTFTGKEKGQRKGGKDIPIKLIQDDDTFNAMIVSKGTMGIIYSVILRVEPKYWIHEERNVITWEEFKHGFLKKILDHSEDRRKKLEESKEDPHYYEFQVNPYINKDGDHSVLLTKRWKLLQQTHENDNPCFRGQCGKEIGTQAVIYIQKGLELLMNSHPSIAIDTVDSSLQIQADESYNNISYEVFNIGDANYIDVKAIELHFDVKDTVCVIERMFQTAEELEKAGIVQNVPFAGRFIKASDSLVSMQNGRDTMSLEIIVLQGINGGAELLKRYESEYIEDCVLMARPHWGLTMNYLKNESACRRLYSNTWDTWMKVYRQFNKGSFDGKFTDRLGISINPP